MLCIAHGAVLAFGLAGMAYVAHDGAAPQAVGYAAVRMQDRAVPTVGEAAMALADAHRVQPGLVVPHKPAQGFSASTSRQPSAALAALGLPLFDLSTGDDGLSPEMARVRDWISDTYRVSDEVLEPALMAAEESAEEHGFDPLLIVAIMAVESSFNPRAVSNMGAQGLMQVMPRYHQDKIGQGRDKYALFDPGLNVRVGALVLQEGLQRYGSMQRALQYYNGSLKDPNARYTRKVMAIKKRLVAASGRETLVQNETSASAG
ncbi:lytic transglycosylase [Thauera linaloolentis 47Lol = DSM 12138]|uniref:Lytic transglycosylase n=1 Tax=Thauera linaloolentis (strain DSM 12138 / JCM 21573 / CCUG 41526 / CIP 105981 / IAM 15112 / NBRC 102519 / 47Lol) TaxID=1123367 RepID=N6Z7L5_THAL4|nr:lytic transglycosylase [Thauera linaloolentis 47Lol = DSM 12138]